MKRVLIVAAEASADIHAANLLKASSQVFKGDIEFSGIGGDKLISTGLFTPEFYNREFAVSGLWELLGHIRKIRKALKYFKNMARLGSYDAAVLLDYPDFNIPLAKFLSKRGIPVVYYISPQVWVWRSSRAEKLYKYSKSILCIFPFEKDFYSSKGLDVSYVGHPLLDELDNYNKTKDVTKLKKELSIKKGQKLISVLPGSRHAEIKYIMPVMEKACKIIKEKLGDDVLFLLPLAPTIKVQDIMAAMSEPENISLFRILKDEKSSYDAYSLSDYAILASGTATVEAGLFSVPMTIVYKVSSLSAFLFKKIIRYENPIGMVNLLLKEKVAEEFFQDEAKAENIAEDVLSNILDKQSYAKKKAKLEELKAVLDTGLSPSIRAAKELVNYL